MRFYDSPSIERIGFDFYCDIANNIVKLREENGFTQKDLAVKTGIKRIPYIKYGKCENQN